VLFELIIPAIVLFVLVVLVATATLRIRTRWLRVRRERVFGRARLLETAAQDVLARRGYAVEARKLRRTLHVLVDGNASTYTIELDYLVSDLEDRLYVAEVKTGRRAPDPAYTPTRRQLIEYDLAFPEAEGLLLVDMETQRVHEIQFQHRGTC
jgi:hypothetical protein